MLVSVGRGGPAGSQAGRRSITAGRWILPLRQRHCYSIQPSSKLPWASRAMARLAWAPALAGSRAIAAAMQGHSPIDLVLGKTRP